MNRNVLYLYCISVNILFVILQSSYATHCHEINGQRALCIKYAELLSMPVRASNFSRFLSLKIPKRRGSLPSI